MSSRSIPARRAVWCTLALTFAAAHCAPSACIPQARGQQKKGATKAAAASDPRSADRDAVRGAMESLAKAFESGDAKALAGHWTTEGEYVNEDGVTVRGREALEQAFAKFFKISSKASAAVEPSSLRFLARDTAIQEGKVSVRPDSSLAARDARYTALLVREAGNWLLASLQEKPADEVNVHDLDWLVGEWSTKGPDQAAEVTTTYGWDTNKRFLHVRFTIKEKELPLSGHQVIGVDPADGAIHSWTFGADGGIGEATWMRDGDHWVLEAEGTLADGKSLTEKNILRRVNQDTFTWQSVERMLDDQELPDLPPVKITRTKSK